MPELSIIVVLAFATYRLARLVAVDSILHPFRSSMYRWAWVDVDENNPASLADLNDAQAEWLLNHPGLPVVPRGTNGLRTWLYELVTCPHCLGVWFAIAVYCAWRWGGDVALGILAVCAIAGGQSVLASIVSYVSPDPDDEP